MLTHYVKIIYRIFARERGYAFINLLGLAIGFACTIVLALYLKAELSFDEHFSRHEHIFRVVGERNVNGARNLLAPVSPFIGSMVMREVPEVTQFVRFTRVDRSLFRQADIARFWDEVYTVDRSIFDIFDHAPVAGDSASALLTPNSIAVSESFARYYFGSEDALGKTVENGNQVFSIDFVFNDLPANTHLKYHVLLPRNPLRDEAFNSDRGMVEGLLSASDYTYVLVAENYDPKQFAASAESIFRTNIKPVLDNFNLNTTTLSYFLEPLSQIHLRSNAEQDLPRGNVFYLYAISAVAIFVMLVAFTNYINLATARYTTRAKEIGIRKILGSGRLPLILRFLLESTLFSILAMIMGIVMIQVVLELTPISALAGDALSTGFLSNPKILFPIILFTLVTGLLSGIYPALYLTAVVPMSELSKAKPGSRKNESVRRGLVFVQLAISISVISSVILMYFQMKYLDEIPLGFEKESKLVLSLRGADNIQRIPAFVNALQQEGVILSAATMDRVPGELLPNAEQPVEGNDGSFSQVLRFARTVVSPDYLPTLGIELMEGRNFNEVDMSGTGRPVLVNEAFVREMGWTEALGRRIGNAARGDEIIGVVRDYHFRSLHEPVTPLEVRLDLAKFEAMSPEQLARQNRMLILNLAPGQMDSALDSIRANWDVAFASMPFEYKFLEDRLAEFYVPEKKQMTFISLFASFCIFVTCLGLLGLAAFSAEIRSQEIAVRRVFGASVPQVVLLFFKHIFVLLIGAALLASLTSYLVVSNWLESFYYRGEIDLITLFLSCVFVGSLVYATVAAQIFIVARRNVATALRCQ